jgi:hypothetical protein
MSNGREFTVVMWLKLNERAPELLKKIALLEPFVPFESTEYKGTRDFHWKFDDRTDAEGFISALEDFSTAPEVTVLRLTNHRDVRLTVKDSRHTKH